MGVEEQQRQWPKQDEVAEEEMALQGRRARKLSAAAVHVSDGSSSDKMFLTSDAVNESQDEDEESPQEEHRVGNADSSEVELELDWQQKSENDARSGDEMFPSLEPIHGFQEQEELLQTGSNVQLDSQQKSNKNVYYEEDEGTESSSRYSENENNAIRGSAPEKNLGGHGFIATIIKDDIQRDANFSGFRLQPPEKSSEHETNKSFGHLTEAHDEVVLIKEIDKELTELDVVRLLEKQDTHDLYCPNCNSCITRKVILRNKLETAVASELEVDISLEGSMEDAVEDYNSVTEPEIFRCLSCFSFFIPSGKGFMLFKKFGDESEKESIQSPQPISAVKKNWLSSIFVFRKEETLTKQDAVGLDNLQLDMSHQLNSSSLLNEMLPNDGNDQPATQLPGRTPVHTEEPAENILSKPQQGECEDSKLLTPSPVLGESDITEKVNILADFPHENGQKIATTLPISSVVEARNVDVKIRETSYSYEASQHAIMGTKVAIHLEETLKSDKGAISLSVPDGLLLQDTEVNITKDDLSLTTSSHQGGDTIITIKEHFESAVSQEVQDTITSPETVPLLCNDSSEVRGSRGLEIIKSTVYGGLMESIASIGIVSSATGADATTLNILALALANLVGGLFIIGHNLWELKNNQSEAVSEQETTMGINQYQELLGRRENFLLHATVAILSFVIFGLIPPVVYGFSFRVSDNMDHKLIAVAVASLLCIVILAVGKAYVRRPPKAYVKTVAYYVVMGLMTSGVSYAVGDLIKKLVEKLGWFDSVSSLVLNLPVLGA